MSQQPRVVFSGVQPTSDSLHLGNTLPPVALFALGYCISLLAGHVSYLAIERPVTHWLSRVWKAKY